MALELLEMGWPQAESHPQIPPIECRLDVTAEELRCLGY